MAETKDQKTQLNINLNAAATPVLYTDNVFMSVNEDGVVLDVCQRIGQTADMQVVARIGMSASHAQKLVKQLGDLLIGNAGRVQTGKEVN
jgi:hypothetical protein